MEEKERILQERELNKQKIEIFKELQYSLLQSQIEELTIQEQIEQKRRQEMIEVND